MRVPHKPTLGEKIRRAIEMPGIRRAELNQRLAIAGVVLAVALYFIISPLVGRLYSSGPKGPTVKGLSLGAAKAALKEKR